MKIVKHEVGAVTCVSNICILKLITENAGDKSLSICSTSRGTYVISPQVGTYKRAHVKKKNKGHETLGFTLNEVDFTVALAAGTESSRMVFLILFTSISI